MKKILFVFVLSVGLFSPVAGSNAEEQRTYMSPYFNFTINYPSSWQARELSGMVFFLSPREGNSDGFTENVGVTIEDLANNPMSLDEYETISLTNAPSIIPAFKLIEKNNAKIDGKDAYFMVYTGSAQTRSLKYKSYTFIADSKAFTLTYSAEKKNYDKYLKRAELIMKSIKITH